MEPEILIATCKVQLAATVPDGKPSGEVVALVASFGIPDAHKRVIRRGTFTDSINGWITSGDRVPLIYAHDYSPQSFIGSIDPATGLEETDEGLVARGVIDLDDPEGAKVHRLLSRRTLRDWSYAAVIEKSHTLANGVREVTRASLLEVGPCLLGAGRTRTLMVASRVPGAPGAARRDDAAEALEARRCALGALDRRVSIQLAALGARR